MIVQPQTKPTVKYLVVEVLIVGGVLLGISLAIIPEIENQLAPIQNSGQWQCINGVIYYNGNPVQADCGATPISFNTLLMILGIAGLSILITFPITYLGGRK